MPEVKASSAILIKIYREKGFSSPEFFEYSRGFFEYLIRRYNGGRYDEDIHSACYLRLLQSTTYGSIDKHGVYRPPYYSPEKTNIATFIFSTVRNYITSNQYRENKQVDDFESATMNFDDGQEELEEISSVLDFSENGVDKIKKSGYSFDMKEELIEAVGQQGFNSPLYRNILWELSKEEHSTEHG